MIGRRGVRERVREWGEWRRKEMNEVQAGGENMGREERVDKGRKKEESEKRGEGEERKISREINGISRKEKWVERKRGR